MKRVVECPRSSWPVSPRRTRLAFLATLALTVSGCETNTPAIIDTSCAVFAPITLSSKDTPKTVDQILAMVKGEQLLSEFRRNELLHLFRTHRVDRDNRFMPFESLSRREGEVLCLLMEGHSVAKIAESSFVSIGTVRTQVKAILRKLGVNSQAAAVALAYRSGWPDADPALPVDLRLRSLS